MISNYRPVDWDIFIGIDVDKSSFAFTVKDHGHMNRSKKIPADPERFYNYIQNNFSDKSVLCAYEAGPTGYGLYDTLKAKGQPCLVVSPMSIPKPPNQRVKNNRIDSNKLSRHLKNGDLKSIRVPQGKYRELRHLVRIRDNYCKNQMIAKQRIKALLLFDNLHPALKDVDQNWSNNYIKQLKILKCTPAVRQRLDMLLMDLQFARQQIVEATRMLRVFCKNDAEIKTNLKYLISVDGIGFITATLLLSHIGDPKNLRNVRELGAFIGVVPSEYSTGNAVHKGSITHLGSRRLRSVLVEAAWAAVRKNTQLNQFYHRVKAKHHPKMAARKAIVAVARKLTCIIYAVLKEQRMFVAK